MHNSRTYVEACCNLGQNCLLKNAIGWCCWDNTTPMPSPEASVSKVNGKEKSGKGSTGVVPTEVFKA